MTIVIYYHGIKAKFNLNSPHFHPVNDILAQYNDNHKNELTNTPATYNMDESHKHNVESKKQTESSTYGTIPFR